MGILWFSIGLYIITLIFYIPWMGFRDKDVNKYQAIMIFIPYLNSIYLLYVFFKLCTSPRISLKEFIKQLNDI